MGTWNTAINGNDTFLDIYEAFFEQYNLGEEPETISKQLQEAFQEEFENLDERNNCLFGLVLAQWETKSLDPKLYALTKEVIETEHDLMVWKSWGADDFTLKKRKTVLAKFLVRISSEKEQPKRRLKAKLVS